MSAKMDSGKRFEGNVSRSLHALDGASMRIEDGGRYAMNRQLADFLYWPDFPATFAIECKSTRGKSFPMGRIGYGERNGQLYRLTAWHDEHAKRYAVVLLEFYNEYRSDKRCYAIEAHWLRRLADACYRNGRRSVPEDAIATAGIACPWSGGMYDLLPLLEIGG